MSLQYKNHITRVEDMRNSCMIVLEKTEGNMSLRITLNIYSKILFKN
jgi:hypothetical protein